VHGRSDATLNPGGVRIGTAEVYRALESVPEIVEAAAVGKKVIAPGDTRATDEEVWLAVVLTQGATLDAGLRSRVAAAVRRNASPRHVPKVVFQVADLPRTRSGKLMELTVARLVNGLGPGDVDAVANPASLGAVRAALAALSRDNEV
jgi:acetoacetyl-CoA synthetase